MASGIPIWSGEKISSIQNKVFLIVFLWYISWDVYHTNTHARRQFEKKEQMSLNKQKCDMYILHVIF